MTVRYVKDNKYVQYRLMSDSFNTTEANWQGVADEVKAGSKGLVDSNAIVKNQSQFITQTYANKTLILEFGGINSTTGEPNTLQKRCRNSSLLLGKSSIVVNSGYRIVNISEYDNLGDFIPDSGILFEGVVTAYISTSENNIKYTFARLDDAAIEPSEYSSIIRAFSDITSNIPSYYDYAGVTAVEFYGGTNKITIESIIIVDSIRHYRTITQIQHTFTFDTLLNAPQALIYNRLTKEVNIVTSNILGEYDVLLILRESDGKYSTGVLMGEYAKSVGQTYNNPIQKLLKNDSNKKSLSIDITDGLRNVNAINGEFESTETNGHYANEIELVGDEVLVEFPSFKF